MFMNKAFNWLAIVAATTSLSLTALAKDFKLLNVSYDPTRELYQEFNAAFAKYWKEKTGDTVTIQQSPLAKPPRGAWALTGI